MKKVKIVLIAVLSCLAIIMTVGMLQIINGNWKMVHFSWGGNWGLQQPTLQNRTETDMTGVSEFLIDCSRAPYDVIFLPGESGKLVVEEYFTETLEENQYAKFSVSGSTLEIRQKIERINFFIMSGSYWGYLKVYLPAEAYASLVDLTVRTSSGDINLPEWSGLSEEDFRLSNAELSSSSGDIDISYLSADNIQISSSSGDIGIGHIVADNIKVSSSSGDQTINEAVGRLEVSATSGDLIVYGVQGSVEAGTSSGYITLGEITGSLKANASSGDIKVQKINEDAVVKTSSGYITMEEVLGGLSTNSSSGDQRIGSVAGNIHTVSTSGDQFVRAAGGSVNMQSSSGAIRLESLAGKAEFNTTSGGVHAYVDKWAGDVNVSCSSGDVEIRMSEDDSIDFKASTSSGSIRTPFDDQLKFDRRQKKADGQINGGGYSLNINTTGGDILIRFQ